MGFRAHAKVPKMDYEYQHYRRLPGSTLGRIIAAHPIIALDDAAAIAAAHQYLSQLIHRTDFAVLAGSDGRAVRKWGADHA